MKRPLRRSAPTLASSWIRRVVFPMAADNEISERARMATMKVVEIAEANAPFRLVERPIPEPQSGEVRIRVEACGICHSDMYPKTGTFPGIAYPRVPGHEVAGVIDAGGARLNGGGARQRRRGGLLAG